jgi:hypothetical protein
MRWLVILFFACGCATGSPSPEELSESNTTTDSDGGSDGASVCADVNTPANCSACSSTDDCQPNGCYGGYFCDTQTNHCKAPTACP